MKARKLERAVQLQEISELRRKNVGEYFVNFTTHLRPWLQELAKKYKERGEFPLMPMVLLPSYYEDVRDKEVAVFAGMLISDGETIGHSTFDKVAAFKRLLGDSPWDWFAERRFVSLSIGKNLHKRTGSVENWKIAKLMDRLWQECFGKTETHTTIGQAIKDFSDKQMCSYFEVLTYLLEDCGVGDYFYKLRLLLMVLCSGDGFGLSLWQNHNAQDTLRCPLTPDIRLFLQTWFPNYRTYGNADDAIRLFGVGETDFFYAWLGYKELQKRNPKGCSELATRYFAWYDGGIKKKPHQWRAILPEIEL